VWLIYRSYRHCDRPTDIIEQNIIRACSVTDKPFEVRGSTIVELADGKISRKSDYWDLATYRRQVGLIK